jgi:hypothetical protein
MYTTVTSNTTSHIRHPNNNSLKIENSSIYQYNTQSWTSLFPSNIVPERRMVIYFHWTIFFLELFYLIVARF